MWLKFYVISVSHPSGWHNSAETCRIKKRTVLLPVLYVHLFGLVKENKFIIGISIYRIKSRSFHNAYVRCSP